MFPPPDLCWAGLASTILGLRFNIDFRVKRVAVVRLTGAGSNIRNS